MTTAYQYAEAHAADFVNELKELLRIPSISTLTTHAGEIRRAAEWLRDHCEKIGFKRAEVMETGGHPLVYAEWLEAPNAPTVLVYGHYDVQPVDDLHKEWKTDPFDPTEVDGNLYARGAADDKGQAFIHLKAFDAIMRATGTFPVNIKIFFEGEEEYGSRNLEKFIENNLPLLKADLAVISDTDVLSVDQPSIVYGLRGLVYTELEVFGPVKDLHSGSYGGVVHNPALALAQIIAKLHDEHGNVTVPGFYDDVRPLSEEERKALAEVGMSEAKLKEETGVSQQWGVQDFTITERIGARPTLEINGVVGGWTGEGAKTVIPARALAKISCRLVPNQDPDKIFHQLKAHIATLTPPTVRTELRSITPEKLGSPASIVPIESEPMKIAIAAYQHAFGTKPVFMRSGGSIPVAGTFREKMNIPVLLMGFGLPDDNVHAPNEKFNLTMFHRGIQTMTYFYENLAQAFR